MRQQGPNRASRIHGSPRAALVLGKRLRRFRQDLDWSQAYAATQVGLGSTTLERTEKGQREVDIGEIYKYQLAYKFDISEMDKLVQLARATKEGSGEAWFERQADLPEGFSLYGEAEATASVISVWEPSIVAGLLQTPDYARAIIESVEGRPTADVNNRLAFRLGRQEAVLSEPAPQINVVLTSAALRVVVGSDEIVERQLEHLRDLSRRAPNIDLRIRPERARHHPDLGGRFTILEFPQDDGDEFQTSPALYFETYLGGRFSEEPYWVDPMKDLFTKIMADAMPIGEYL